MRSILSSSVIVAVALFISPAFAEEQLAMVGGPGNVLSDTYPHVTALENAILGQSFIGQPLPERLGRMEKKAFGKVSTKSDLSDRTDDLDDYTEKTLHKNLLHANVDEETPDPMETVNSTAPLTSQSAQMDTGQTQMNQMQISQTQTSQSQGDYPHITSLEQAILGQTYAGQPLADRLARMEVKAFGQVSTNSDLGDRTDALETYAEKKLHKKPLVPQGDDTITSSPQQGGGLLSKVGQAFLGMAGGSALNTMMGNSFGGLGPNLGGLGSSAPGSGFGGVNVRRRQASDMQQQTEPPAPSHPEDPAVYQATPPDPSARLIVKVGWCEVKVFGHTFPAMHLPERLGQLNKELKLEPGKSDIQLMDDIGLMIKTVQARKPVAPVIQP